MKTLSKHGQEQIDELAQRHGFSSAAVLSMLDAIVSGYGGMAQFNHPEFGGNGQWMDGGMTMVSDLFNHDLKHRVDRLCSDLAALVRAEPEFARAGAMNVQTQSQFSQDGSQESSVPGVAASHPATATAPASLFAGQDKSGYHNWWPASLGHPSSTGAQNDSLYAWFAGPHRLALSRNGKVTVYDTLDHRISGVSQQQSGGSPLSFTSQNGAVDLSSLPIVDEESDHQSADAGYSYPAPSAKPGASPVPAQQEEKAPAQDNHIALAEALSVETGKKESSVTGGLAHHLAGAGKIVPPAVAPSADIFTMIEKLADLRGKGVLSEQEFSSKKTELLGRL